MSEFKLPWPAHHSMESGQCIGYYTAAQMLEVRRATIAEAANLCDEVGNETDTVDFALNAANDCADAIRSMEC
jgi:hypothetical protein